MDKFTDNKEVVYPTIRDFYGDFLDNKKVIICSFLLDGNSYGANPRTKRFARVSIALPKEICNTNLKDLDNWVLHLVAIPRVEIDKVKKNEIKD